MSDEDERRRLDERARQLGLPTDSAAYQDGGLAVAATANSVQEAELIAAVLKGECVPAWVDQPLTTTVYWYLQYGLHRRGIRVMVPLGRLAEAHEAIARAHEDIKAEEAAEPIEDTAYPLFRSAQRQACMLFLLPLAPVVLVLAVRLLFKIDRHLQTFGSSPDLSRARRFAWIIAILSFPLTGFLAWAGGGVIRQIPIMP